MTVSIIGTNAACQQGTRKRWSYTENETQELRYRGPSDKTAALYELLKAVAGFSPTYDSVEHDPGRGVGEVRAILVADAETLYELIPNTIMKPLEQAKYYSVTATVLTAKEIVEAYSSRDDGIDPTLSGFTGKQQEFYLDLCVGMTHVQETSYVLRETKIVSKRSTVTASYANVNRVTSPPDTSAANTLIGSLAGLGGEWLKCAPSVRTYGSRRWIISQEWLWADHWSKLHYGGTWEPSAT